MIGYVMVGTNNLDQSIKFYDELLAVIGLARIEKDEVCAGYSQKDGPDRVEFYVTKPFNGENATVGNGSMVSFLVMEKGQVDLFHDIALQNGAINEGDPGPRPSGGSVYYSYIRDLDGNKICAYAKI